MEDHKKTYIWNAIWLAVITVLEVGMYNATLPRAGVVTLLLASTITKMILVAMIYMHLRYETKILRRIVVLPIPLALIFLFGLMYDLSFEWFK